MKPGEEVICPHCGAEAFLVKKSEMDGWTKLGDILACSACKAKIADLPGKEAAKAAAQDAGKAKLAAFLGTQAEDKKRIVAKEDEKRFCRDCAHLIEHPFLTRCDLHQKNVNTMDDCPDFKPKTEAEPPSPQPQPKSKSP